MSVFEDRGSYYIRFKVPYKGTWKSKVCGAKTKTEANSIDTEVDRFISMKVNGSEEPFSTYLQEPAKSNLLQLVNWISEKYFNRSHVDAPETLGDLMKWFVAKKKSETRIGDDPDDAKHKKRLSAIGPILAHRIANIPPHRVHSGMLEDFKNEMVRTKSARGTLYKEKTVNRLLVDISSAYNKARKKKVISCKNPMEDVEKFSIIHVPIENNLETIEEVSSVISVVKQEFIDIIATGIFSGLRQGELFALEKTSIDFDKLEIIVSKSNASNRTKTGEKTGKIEIIPIISELVSYLKHAFSLFPANKLVFPNPRTGERYSRHTNLREVLRNAVRKSGISCKYKYICSDCKTNEIRNGEIDLECVGCGKKMNSEPAIRFYDLRHTTASLFVDIGASEDDVRKLMRHSDVKITQQYYIHSRTNTLRMNLDKRLSTAKENSEKPIPAQAQSVAVVAPSSTQFVGKSLQIADFEENTNNKNRENSSNINHMNGACKVATAVAHNPKVVGSNPAPATIFEMAGCSTELQPAVMQEVLGSPGKLGDPITFSANAPSCSQSVGSLSENLIRQDLSPLHTQVGEHLIAALQGWYEHQDPKELRRLLLQILTLLERD